MKKEIIVDTSALIAFFVRSETHHRAAKDYVIKHPSIGWIILESVFNKTVTWIRTKFSLKASIEVGQVLREEHHYIPLSDTDNSAIWQAFCKYDDKA